MRIPQVLAALVLIVALSGCSVGATTIVESADQQADTADDTATKADVASAKTAVIAYLTTEPSATSVDPDDLAAYGYPDGVELHFTSAQSFCVDAESPSGTTFMATPDGSVAEGECS